MWRRLLTALGVRRSLPCDPRRRLLEVAQQIRAAFFLINKEAQKYAATAAQSDETCLSRQAAPSLRSSHIPDPADRARETVPLARCGAS